MSVINKNIKERSKSTLIKTAGIVSGGSSPDAAFLLEQLLKENPVLAAQARNAGTPSGFSGEVRRLAMEYMEAHPHAFSFYRFEAVGREAMEQLTWQDYAAIRILDYLDHAGQRYNDLNLRGEQVLNDPFALLWKLVHGKETIEGTAFLRDMIHLFRQFYGKAERKLPSRERVLDWMKKHPSGLDPEIIRIREKNKERIIRVLIEKIDRKVLQSKRFFFPEGISYDEKLSLMHEWWDNYLFHLKFAIRKPDLLNEMLGNTLDEETMAVLYTARDRGIPFFINPYYLSLLNVDAPEFAADKDLAIRYYVIYSKQLVDEFGHIVAWEKEDIVEPGKPNAAGWILPTRHNVHRRYPEVAIMIPDTMGRACAGLCASCQRMYDFQRGNLNFNLDELLPKQSWNAKLEMIMKYWEEDSQLRDILITGGDALMSSDKSMEKILGAVYEMALRKKEKNAGRPEGEKYAEIVRVRLGTRLPAYLPQRVTENLTRILAEFKEKASRIGIKQFVIQTHLQSPMEVTPETRLCISRLKSAGWTVTNQLVFTAPAARRGHTAKLRQVLNDIGVLPYYTFSVKGYKENSEKFATNARAAQEQTEEKVIGHIPAAYRKRIRRFPLEAEHMVENINALREEAGIPFLATDRNVLNLPGVGKSMTYRVIGITSKGRRILEFDHDHTRSHSPIIDKLGKFTIIESKSLEDYLEQMNEMGEDPADYSSIWGYSIGETEPRMSIYEYPDFDFGLTGTITNYGG
ncbi:MAG: KamA family protein [Bacteroidales bacterium]|nr:KamA family protein [Bacteroidales bacterium]